MRKSERRKEDLGEGRGRGFSAPSPQSPPSRSPSLFPITLATQANLSLAVHSITPRNGTGYLSGRVIINSCHYSYLVSFVQNILIWCVDLTIQINIIMILYFNKSLYRDYRNI